LKAATLVFLKNQSHVYSVKVPSIFTIPKGINSIPGFSQEQKHCVDVSELASYGNLLYESLPLKLHLFL